MPVPFTDAPHAHRKLGCRHCANHKAAESFCRISATSLASEYALSAAAIARAFTSYAGSLVAGEADFFRISTGSEYCLIDIPALLLVGVLCGVLAAGTQSGARFNTIVTGGNLVVIAFVLATGLPHLQPTYFVPFMPMGIRGTFSGASKVCPRYPSSMAHSIVGTTFPSICLFLVPGFVLPWLVLLYMRWRLGMG